MKILVVRPDRLGDVILSTPVIGAIRKHFPSAQLHFMVRPPMAGLLEGLDSITRVMVYEPEGKGRHSGIRGFFRLIGDVRRSRFQTAIVLQSHWKIAWALLLAWVPNRVGPLSAWYSWLTFNRGMRQHRSRVEMHEADYNLQLLHKLGIRAQRIEFPTLAHVPDEVCRDASEWLRSQGWNPPQPLIAVHPGMGGSALNWPQEHYQELVLGLVREGFTVLVTGGPSEGAYLRGIRERLGEFREKVIFYEGRHNRGLVWLGALYRNASVVVAPSTGPLHLAVALGRRVVTFFSPIRVQSAIRWGPWLADESRAHMLVPEVYCGQDFKCRGELCNYFPCMKTLAVEEVLAAVREQLRRES